MSKPYIDSSVYPDCDPPDDFKDDFERADYIDRICTALDFGIVPESKTLSLLSKWKNIFDQFPVSQSSGYHALRNLFEWEDVPKLPYFKTPYYLILDREEGRTDSCENLV